MISVDSDGFWPLKVTAQIEDGLDTNYVLRVWFRNRLVEETHVLTSMLGAAEQAVMLHSRWFLCDEPIQKGSENV